MARGTLRAILGAFGGMMLLGGCYAPYAATGYGVPVHASAGGPDLYDAPVYDTPVYDSYEPAYAEPYAVGGASLNIAIYDDGPDYYEHRPHRPKRGKGYHGHRPRGDVYRDHGRHRPVYRKDDRRRDHAHGKGKGFRDGVADRRARELARLRERERARDGNKARGRVLAGKDRHRAGTRDRRGTQNVGWHALDGRADRVRHADLRGGRPDRDRPRAGSGRGGRDGVRAGGRGGRDGVARGGRGGRDGARGGRGGRDGVARGGRSGRGGDRVADRGRGDRWRRNEGENRYPRRKMTHDPWDPMTGYNRQDPVTGRPPVHQFSER